jgi:hypothetical protein
VLVSDDAGPLILEMHRIDGAPWSPMQMISAELLAHYRRCEEELAVFKSGCASGRCEYVGAASEGRRYCKGAKIKICD